MEPAIQNKLDRVSDGAAPRVLDLFSGCGGLSLGFARAGFEIVGAVEFDAEAVRTHARNFHAGVRDGDADVHAVARDITRVTPAELGAEFGWNGPPDSWVDLVIGGPPCQAFARIGRAKLREIAEHPQAFLEDPRANLFRRYLDYVADLRPLAVLMENVPDVINHGGRNIPHEVCEALEKLGYDCGYTLLNAVAYGVPQMRDRMFLLAFHRDLAADVGFPAPTHWIDLPRGYHATRQVALRNVPQNLLGDDHFFVPPTDPTPDLLPAATAQAALRDLPRISTHLEGRMKKGPARFDEWLSYPRSPRPSEYGKLMRTWPGYSSPEGVCDHVIRYLPRDYAIFRRMAPGDQYPEAHAVARAIFEERLAELRQDGRVVPEGSAEWQELRASVIPPYDPGKFPNKWRKMEPDRPSRTLMAHIGKDSYSHIHYDSSQARTISVREAARLQSFPDGFRFAGAMNSAFRQIGNAVPPLLAGALADHIRSALRDAEPVDQAFAVRSAA